ncbi:MAG: hypothetical protein J2P29_07000, partial [Actinobacteria bacterium]|nr:hypothetical protein [Actinomycetota bacterium]
YCLAGRGPRGTYTAQWDERAQRCLPGALAGSPALHLLDQLPAGQHYWLFQGAHAALLITLAVALAALAIWLLRRRPV